MLLRAERRYFGGDEENGTCNIAVPAEVDASDQNFVGCHTMHSCLYFQQIMVHTIDTIYNPHLLRMFSPTLCIRQKPPQDVLTPSEIASKVKTLK